MSAFTVAIGGGAGRFCIVRLFAPPTSFYLSTEGAMAIISDKHDAMLRAGCITFMVPSGSDTTFLTAVKTWLDANIGPRFKDPAAGDYTVPHVLQAVNAVRKP